MIVGIAVYGPWSVSTNPPPGLEKKPVTAPIMSNGAVSPIARESVRIVPVKIPGAA
jgi:hypothetical protein